MEAFDFTVNGAAGNRTPDFMTASPPPLPHDMYDLIIIRGRCLSAGGLPAGASDRTLCLVMTVYYTKTIHSPLRVGGVCRKRGRLVTLSHRGLDDSRSAYRVGKWGGPIFAQHKPATITIKTCRIMSAPQIGGNGVIAEPSIQRAAGISIVWRRLKISTKRDEECELCREFLRVAQLRLIEETSLVKC